MSRDVTGSVEFLAEAAALAVRLLEHGRSIFDLRYDGLALRSWVVTAGTPKRRVMVSWDGRDGRLSAEAAGFADSPSRPSRRTVFEQQPADRSPAALLGLTEQVILRESGAPAA